MKRLLNIFGRKKRIPPPFEWTNSWEMDFWFSHHDGHYYRYFTFAGKNYVVVIKGFHTWSMWIVDLDKKKETGLITGAITYHNHNFSSCHGMYDAEISRIQNMVDKVVEPIMRKNK